MANRLITATSCPGCNRTKTEVSWSLIVDLATLAVHWLKIFNTVAAGSLTILLTSCTNLAAPKTLFVTFGASEENFKDDSEQIRAVLNKYTEAFQRLNPDTNVVWINYKANRILEQITKDSALNLGPDVVIAQQYFADQLLAKDLTTTLPDQQYLDDIYGSQIQSIAKTTNEYAYAPWLVSAQIACFNNTTIKTSPDTIKGLEKLSASGKKIGLSSNLYDLIWTAGSHGAVVELSSIGDKTATTQTYPATQRWLQWLQKAALYQNIYFHENSRELSNKLKSKELDWITCRGDQLRDLKKSLGNSLGVAALPNGTASKAFPTQIIYGFSLGKNSSPNQQTMAIKLIKTAVNAIAQRKIVLGNSGFLAANQNVAIPPQSSKILVALNTSFNEQSKHYSKELPGVVRWFLPEQANSENHGKRYRQLRRTLTELTDGYLDINEALKIITTTQTN